MGKIRDAFWETFRDFKTQSVPASGANDPAKRDIRAIALLIEADIAAAALSGTDLNSAMALVQPLLDSAQAAQSAADDALAAAVAVVAGVNAAVSAQLNGAVAAATVQAKLARDQAQALRSEAQAFSIAAANSFSSIDALDHMYPSQAAGEAAVTNGHFTFVDGGNNIVYVRRAAGVSTIISPGAFINLSGSQTVTGTKTFAGATRFATNGSRLGITDAASPITPQALLEISNTGSTTNSLRVNSIWTGTTAQPYTNNDTTLFETFNKVLSDSANLSWSLSAPNAYNDIPFGVHDSGERVGVYGWATSVNIPGQYVHAGRLTSQIGVRGRAGFQGIGTPNTAVIDRANGVQGEIRADSVGATIRDGRAGYFTSIISPGTGVVENNIGVYAEVSGGTEANWAWFSPSGDFYQQDRAYFGDGSFTAGQSAAAISARGVRPNAVEFGNGDPGGYGSNLGATVSSGVPFVAFCAEAMPAGNAFRTRGRPGVIMYSDLAGALVFGRLPNATASGQSPADSAFFAANGKFVTLENQRLPSKPPASATATGEVGEVAWDAGYFYVCTATDTWKRVALTSW